MSTRWRCSPRRKISPAAWPTLSASSGVIVPLARPRMPSVPKYFRAMSPQPARCEVPSGMIGQLPEFFKNASGFSRVWIRRRGGTPRKRLDLLFSLIVGGRRRLSDVNRIGGGKAVLETLFERTLEPALAHLLHGRAWSYRRTRPLRWPVSDLPYIFSCKRRRDRAFMQ